MHSTEFTKLALENSSTTKTSGIYYIYCLSSNKIYVGSSKNIIRRWREHKNRLTNNKHPNPYLQATYNKYGQSSFVFRVLENCSEEHLQDRENHYIKLIDEELRLNLGSPIRNGQISEETRIKLSKNTKGLRRGPLSKAHKEKLSQTLKGRKFSFETKKKMSESSKKIKQRITYSQKNYKLTFSQVIEIKKLLRRRFLLNYEIAEIYGVDSRTIAQINSGDKWKKIESPIELSISEDLSQKEKNFNPNLVDVKYRRPANALVAKIYRLTKQKLTEEEICVKCSLNTTQLYALKNSKAWASYIKKF